MSTNMNMELNQRPWRGTHILKPIHAIRRFNRIHVANALSAMGFRDPYKVNLSGLTGPQLQTLYHKVTKSYVHESVAGNSGTS